MADIIDQANDVAEQMLTAQRSVRKHSKLVPAGSCHYCDELLPKVGQLFCNTECRVDFEREDRLRERAGR
jgi:hypothetical protein